MEQIVLAFERETINLRVKEILESSGTADCLLCASADQVRRTVYKRHITTVVCGYKLREQSVELLAEDLPPFCSILVLAAQDRLDLLENNDIFRLPAPTSKRDLIATIQMLLRMGHRLERFVRPSRSPEEQVVIDQAKRLLMDRNDMTEEQAHRFLQKTSMDNGAKLIQTAQLVLDSGEIG